MISDAQAEPAVHEVPRQSPGTRIVHGVAQRGDTTRRVIFGVAPYSFYLAPGFVLLARALPSGARGFRLHQSPSAYAQGY